MRQAAKQVIAAPAVLLKGMNLIVSAGFALEMQGRVMSFTWCKPS
jgi:hypothetical protein